MEEFFNKHAGNFKTAVNFLCCDKEMRCVDALIDVRGNTIIIDSRIKLDYNHKGELVKIYATRVEDANKLHGELIGYDESDN